MKEKLTTSEGESEDTHTHTQTMQKRSASEAKLNNKFKNRSNDHTQVKEMRPQAKEK